MDYSEVISRLKNKDAKALEQVITEYNHYVTAIVYNILKSCASAPDIQGIVNQVFFQLWQNTEKIDTDRFHDLKPYLAKTARNAAINERRKKRAEITVEDELLGNVDDALKLTELRYILNSAVGRLSEEEQKLIVSYYFYEMPIREIAGQLRLSESAVKTKLHRCRLKLKTFLEKEGVFHENDLL